MSVTVLCPNLKCRMILSVPDQVRGKKVRCKYCGMTFIVPEKAGTVLRREGDKKASP
ncbi:MAG: hypothetical protein GX629_10290 [Phycisphaerae bacterium]|nr:hypothetical protein [Phycisphaerae bacterium]